jgi:HPt (histidine-containing phosphotransfer) domain-containing protein
LSEASETLVDRSLVEEIRRIERATGRNDVLSGLISTLESSIVGFPQAFSDCLTRGDKAGAVRAAHTLKGTCRQLGAMALGELFAAIEASAKAGNYDEAQGKYDDGVLLIARSIEALRNA